MHCPKCGQQQVSEETRFCSRCGLLLSEIAALVSNEGVNTGKAETKLSARTRGLKQGLFLLLSSMLVVPIAAVVTVASNSEPFVAAALLFLTVVGGLLRMVYALMFESGEPGSVTVEQTLIAKTDKALKQRRRNAALNPAPAPAETQFYSAPVSSNWMDTNDLAGERPSVTDNTTKLLENAQGQNRER